MISQTHPQSPPHASETPNLELRLIKVVPVGDVVHVFSHIRKTYRVQWVVLEGGDEPPATRADKTQPMEKNGKGRPQKDKSTASQRATRDSTSPQSGYMWARLEGVAALK